MNRSGVIERDQLVDSLLDRIDELERRVTELEAMHPGSPGQEADTLAYFDENGELHAELMTESLALVDAGSAGATEQDWIEVEVGGVVGYVRVYAGK